jgi:hypothetical protein
MRERVLLNAFFAVALAGFCAVSLSPAVAESAPQRSTLSSESIQRFLANPPSLLADHPNGGSRMVAQVRDLSTSDHATLDALVGLLTMANSDQATAIGIGLGQTAVRVVKTDQAYADRIQTAIVGADRDQNAIKAAGPGSAKPKIGSAVKTIDQVEGVTENGPEPVIAGSQVFRDELVRTGVSGKAELLFADRTNLSIGPVTEIRLDKFVYDPDAKQGNIVIRASEGVFRFITGTLAHKNYSIATPFATLGVRGTMFLVRISKEQVEVQLLEGEMYGRTISNKLFTLSKPNTMMSIDSNGNTHGPTVVNAPLENFADLGSPVTHLAQADATTAFASVTGNTSIGAAGTGGEGGGAGGGGGGTGGGGTGQGFGPSLSGGLGAGSLSLRTSIATTPSINLLALSFSSTAGAASGASQNVSPHVP